jgi:sulfur carrier protein
MELNITINQTPYTLPSGMTLEQLIEQQQLPDKGCVFILNERVISKTQWKQITLNDGDQISLFQVIAGG